MTPYYVYLSHFPDSNRQLYHGAASVHVVFVVVCMSTEVHHAGRPRKRPLLDRSRADATVIDPNLNIVEIELIDLLRLMLQ